MPGTASLLLCYRSLPSEGRGVRGRLSSKVKKICKRRFCRSHSGCSQAKEVLLLSLLVSKVTHVRAEPETRPGHGHRPGSGVQVVTTKTWA